MVWMVPVALAWLMVFFKVWSGMGITGQLENDAIRLHDSLRRLFLLWKVSPEAQAHRLAATEGGAGADATPGPVGWATETQYIVHYAMWAALVALNTAVIGLARRAHCTERAGVPDIHHPFNFLYRGLSAKPQLILN